MPLNAAQRFERETAMHDTRGSRGIVNRLSSPEWMRYADRVSQLRTVDVLNRTLNTPARMTVVVIGVGGGGLFGWMWADPSVNRIGIDLNHSVLLNSLSAGGGHLFSPVEAEASQLPLAAASVDVVVFDFVLHHLLGQGALHIPIREAYRVLRPNGYIVAREPSSFSPSGLILNVANRFRLMHAISGASNYEFAISPPTLIRIFEESGTVLEVQGLTYLFAHRLPIWCQRAIGIGEQLAGRLVSVDRFADFVLYVVRKNQLADRSAS